MWVLMMIPFMLAAAPFAWMYYGIDTVIDNFIYAFYMIQQFFMGQ